MKELGKLAFLIKDVHCTSVRQRLKTIIIRPLDRNESISPVGNIVTKVRMSVVTRPLCALLSEVLLPWQVTL